MTTFFKDMLKVSNKVEYAVIGFKRDNVRKVIFNNIEDTMMKYIADFFQASLMYDYDSCTSLSIVNARPNIGDEKYNWDSVDWYAIPVAKIILDRDMLLSIRQRIAKQKRYNKGLRMSITDLVRKYAKLNTPVVFPKRKSVLGDSVEFGSLCYEGRKKSWCSDRCYQTNTYYAVLPEMGIHYLNPNSTMSIAQGGKLEAFELVWRECINRRLNRFDVHISKHETKISASSKDECDAEITLNYNHDIEYANRKLNVVCSEISREIKEIVNQRVYERLADFKEILDSCSIDSEEVLQQLVRIIVCGGTSVSRLHTKINLKELMK